jgi:KaiC/GvpD/RAD55 family RecA-like ATPase
MEHRREREIAHTIVPNLLYAERITFLAGEAGVGKTTFALEIADALTRTGKLWGNSVEVQPAKVLWLDFDHAWERLQQIIDAYYGEGERLIYTMRHEDLQPLDESTLPRYRRTIVEEEIDLIVADTAFDWLAVMDANDETEARVKLELVRQLIAGTGCGVLLLHHLRKSAHDTTSTLALSGAHRWAAKVDVVAYLRYNAREGQDIVKLIVSKDRDGERRELEFLRQGRRFIPVDYHAVPTGDWGVARAFLEAHGEATYRELLDALERAGVRMTERALQQRVKRWERKGRVVIERRGFPAIAIVKLAAAQFTHPDTLSIGNHEQTEQTEQTESGGLNSDAPTAAPPAAPPEPTPYDPRSESFEEWLARADTVLDHFYPSFHARAELTWDTIDDWLQQASMPHDPLGLEPHEVDALRVLLAFAEARGFPLLTIPEFGYTIRAGKEGWLTALPDIAGTPAVAVATRLLQSLDAAGEPDAPTPTFTNGNAGLTPLQFTLIQEV